jgi:hypothetical protein
MSAARGSGSCRSRFKFFYSRTIFFNIRYVIPMPRPAERLAEMYGDIYIRAPPIVKMKASPPARITGTEGRSHAGPFRSGRDDVFGDCLLFASKFYGTESNLGHFPCSAYVHTLPLHEKDRAISWGIVSCYLVGPVVRDVNTTSEILPYSHLRT